MTQPSRATEFDLRHEDCVDGMRTLENDSVDVVVTSPPYNLDISYRSYEDSVAREAFLDWCDTWSNEVKRVMREDGSFFLNLGAKTSCFLSGPPWPRPNTLFF